MWFALFLLVIPAIMNLISTRYMAYPASIALALAAFLIRKPMVSYAKSKEITGDIMDILGVVVIIAWLTAHYVLQALPQEVPEKQLERAEEVVKGDIEKVI